MSPRYVLIGLMTGLLLSSCDGGSGNGPAEINWDRDACERCRMVLSDRQYSAQVRYLPEGKRFSRVMWFDDIGCASLWLDDKPWKDEPTTEIWVTDHRNGEWIDARKASFVKGKTTPMDYGLGAQSDPAAGALDFAQAKAHIRKVEAEHNIHSAHLLEKLREKARKGKDSDQPSGDNAR